MIRVGFVFSILFFCINAISGEKFEIPSGLVSLSHSRGDLHLEQISLQVSCFDTNGNWISCRDIKVEGKSIEDSSIDFLTLSQYTAKVPQVSISSDESEGFFCVGIKALFKGFPNVCDSVLYPPYPDRRALDRYSILSYCSKANIEGSGAGARFSSRRVVNWDDYLYLLNQPISLALTSATEDQCVAPEY